jgi:hypothetical protein
VRSPEVEVGEVIPPADLEALTKIGIIGKREFILIVVEPREPGETEMNHVHMNMAPEKLCALIVDFADAIRAKRPDLYGRR